ncbi:hypothetical protein AAG570_010285 [Ranatra chinensis]|uniref:Uncharacterized protein n=1 Tax=Ranatra chinensis TaxID=642074 RepID=A0ABD0ZAG5_9HEMI
MASKRRNMFHKNKTQETTEKAGSQMLVEVRWRNLYNMLIRRVSSEIRADFSITFKTDIKEVVKKLKERYAGARREVARMRRETGETPQQFVHRMDAGSDEHGAREAS